jgi:hypothetical protein
MKLSLISEKAHADEYFATTTTRARSSRFLGSAACIIATLVRLDFGSFEYFATTTLARLDFASFEYFATTTTATTVASLAPRQYCRRLRRTSVIRRESACRAAIA